MEKASIFIDGGYLNRVLKNHFDNQRIDYSKLSEEICKNLNLKRLRTYYYYCAPFVRSGNKADEERAANVQKFIDNLKRLPRFEVKLGRLQYIKGVFKQKMVDLLMSLDIVDMCFGRQIGHAILIAGDSDLVPAIQKAKDTGAIIHLFYHPSSVHNELLDKVDERHQITSDFLDKVKI